MTLIAALIGILLDRLVGHLQYYRQYDYLLQWADWLRSMMPDTFSKGIVGFLMVILPPVLFTAYLQSWISGWMLGDLFGLLFSIAVLLYCLGPRDMAADVETYCEVCTSGDAALRGAAAGRLADSDQALENLTECIARVARAVLVRANDRLFAVLFWFVLLGPAGAVLYRASSVLFRQYMTSNAFGGWCARFHALLVWIPARLTALGFALSGHFDAALEGWRAAHIERPVTVTAAERIIAETGLGALGMRHETPQSDDYQQPVRAALQLVWRNLTVWLVAISVMTLAGWAA